MSRYGIAHALSSQSTRPAVKNCQQIDPSLIIYSTTKLLSVNGLCWPSNPRPLLIRHNATKRCEYYNLIISMPQRVQSKRSSSRWPSLSTRISGVSSPHKSS